MSADEELGLVYLPINTPAPDYYGGSSARRQPLRGEPGRARRRSKRANAPGTSSSFITGLWDYDLPAAPNLIDVTVDGRAVKAVAQITKQGFVFTFDRATGEPLWPIVERPVPTDTNLEGERPSPTQPFPTRPAPFEYQGATFDDLVDFTPEVRAMALEAVEGFRMGPLYTPQSLEGTITRPGSLGGGNWSGAAFDPETGILYVPSRNSHTVTGLREAGPDEEATLRYVQTPTRTPRMPQGLSLWKPPYTRMTAIDMNTGEHVWMTPTGNGDRFRENPLLADLDLPPLGGDGGSAGPVLTSTLLIYPLTAGGSDNGPRLVAYDKTTGEEVASVDLPGAAIGTPMTYMLDGRQYVAITVGGARVPSLVAFALPE
jgi:quinoprotein glucose dehydrogenase